MIYYPGETAVLTATITDGVTGLAFDPASVTFKVKSGKTRLTTPYVYGIDSVVQKIAVGKYSCDVVIPADGRGRWSWRVETGGTLTGADEGTFDVLNTMFG